MLQVVVSFVLASEEEVAVAVVAKEIKEKIEEPLVVEEVVVWDALLEMVDLVEM